MDFYLSTIGADACETAREFGLGLELAQFCTAENLDRRWEAVQPELRRCLASAGRFTLHAPFNELTPAAIDPLVREVAEKRYRQALALAARLRVRKIVVHAGYTPLIYHPVWFYDRSVEFWGRFVEAVPDGTVLCLENVMEPRADFITDIVRAVGSAKLRMCLDVGHANCRVSEEPVARWIEKSAPYLAHVHLHNNDADADLHRPLTEGTLDMAALLRQLPADVTCALEVPRCRESVLWLKQQDFLQGAQTCSTRKKH